MRRTHIAVTCIGGRYTYDLCTALRTADDLDAFIVGIDANADAAGRRFVDVFAVLPMAEEDPERYIAALFALHARERLDVILPGSEAECRVLAAHRDALLAAGIIPAVPAHDIVSCLTDKRATLAFLAARGIAVGAFAVVDDWCVAREAAARLGYPDRRVVLKPGRSTGSRGVIILDARVRTFRSLLPDLPERACGTGSLDAAVAQGIALAGYLAMPYYGGAVYDVDVVARGGIPEQVIPRLRLYDPLLPVNAGCRVACEPDIMEYVGAIVRAFGIHGACDFDIARDADGAPRLLDASVRMSGAVGAAVVAGANVPAAVVRVLLGYPARPEAVHDGLVMYPVAHFAPVIAASVPARVPVL